MGKQKKIKAADADKVTLEGKMIVKESKKSKIIKSNKARKGKHLKKKEIDKIIKARSETSINDENVQKVTGETVANSTTPKKKKKSQKARKRDRAKAAEQNKPANSPTAAAVKEEIKSDDETETKANVAETRPNAPNSAAEQAKLKPVKRNARIIIRNMSFQATEESLKEHFEKYGEVSEVKILRKPGGKLVGCAFIQYKNVPMAKKAILETNMKPFIGRPISVDWAIPKDKYMKHIVETDDAVKKEIKSDDEDDVNNKSSQSVTVKDEPDSDADDKGDSSDAEDSSDEKDEESEDENEDSEEEMDFKGKTVLMDTDVKPENPIIKNKSNDAEDGCTVFLTNVPFSVDKEQLAEFAKKTGPIKYSVICMDPMTEHSRGTAFVKFETSEKAWEFMNLGREALTIDGQAMMAKPALLREHLSNEKTKKQPKDSRNLYLVKEGVIIAGTKAAVGVSASDMAKRLTLEQSKTQMLRNLNRFVSRYRLVLQNLPPNYDDTKLRRLCENSVPGRPTITEARVMRDLRAAAGPDGKYPSKGYAFVMFTRHEDALACLRKLNNNPEIFDKNNRPILSFSIEDRAVLNARKKRLEKSVIKNPLSKQYQKPTDSTFQNTPNARGNLSKPLKRPREDVQSNAQPAKKKKFNKKPRNPEMHGGDTREFRPKTTNNAGEFSGLTSKPGSQHRARSNFKLRKQAEIHRVNVKAEKTQSKKVSKAKLLKNKEKIKQPKQKLNTNKNKTKFKENLSNKTDRNFSDLVSKYKSKLVSGKGEKVKAKWFE